MSQLSKLEIRFGEQACWELDERDSIASYLTPQISPVEDLRVAVQAALENPVEFPTLDQTLVPGDRLALVVDPVLPDAANLFCEVARWFISRGTSPSNMSLIVAGASREHPTYEALAAACSEKWNGEIQVECHEPDDPQKIAYVAANHDAEPIYMNRTLVDADVVIPITCCRARHALDYLGAYGIYPLLSDRKTLGDFYSLQRLQDPNAHQQLTSWADQAAMWAGFMVEIQVIPAGKNEVGDVLAGLTQPLEKVSTRKMQAAWETSIEPAELTVALLDGGSSQQNWLGIARALYSANRCTRDGGAIAVCTSAHEKIGKSLGRLKKSGQNDNSLAKRLAKDDSDDAIAAEMIRDICADKHIYLAAEMTPASIESIGLGPIQSARELNHLIGQFSSTVLLGSAQHRDVIPI